MQHPLLVTLDAARLAYEAARCLYRWRLAPQKFVFALVTVQLMLAAITGFVGYDAKDFAILQLLMVALSITGLLLGAVATERRNAACSCVSNRRNWPAWRISRGWARWAWSSLMKLASRCRR